MIASNEAWNSELRLNVLDQIIQLFDYISIYCSSLTIEHSNSRWRFQLTIWLYIKDIYKSVVARIIVRVVIMMFMI